MSTSPTPIPILPSIPISIPPAAPPPPPPPNLTTIDPPGSIRQILQPVPPSKRPAPAATVSPLNNDSKSHKQNAYLPRELADIITAREIRECAWHVRVMICTSIISCIDGTLAQFKGVEKEEALACQEFLRHAISAFAATDSTQPPPPISTHSRPLKSKEGFRKGKNKGSDAVTTKVAPVLPERAQSNTMTWAKVATIGNKKARVDIPKICSSPPKQSVKLPKQVVHMQSEKVKHNSTSTLKDQRLFIRIAQDHEWRKLSPAGVREVVVKKLSVPPALIGFIKPVRSGFAPSHCNTEGREALLQAANGLFLSNAKLEAASNLTPILVPTVPNSIRTLQGRLEVTKEMLADEIERVCAVRPNFLKMYGHFNQEAPHRTWMAFFTKAPRPGFRVFDESGRSTVFQKQRSLEFCKRCNGHHSSRTCPRAPSCGNCGSSMHTQEACQAISRCKNCGGPHRSDSRQCLVRPTRSGEPTKEQLKVYRQADDREYQAVVRAKMAEARARAAEKATNAPPERVQEEVPNTDTQAAPVVILTDDAMRL